MSNSVPHPLSSARCSALNGDIAPPGDKSISHRSIMFGGIAEEEGAKEMCKTLSDAIHDDELKRFFDFVNYQESYHIELMKKLL